MSKATKMHLENITPEVLEDWRNSAAYSVFASSSGTMGQFELGVNGRGLYYVRNNKSIDIFTNAGEALNKYSELVS